MMTGVLVFTVVGIVKVTSAVLRGQGAEVISALGGADTGLIPRWAATRAVEANLAYRAVSRDAERDVSAGTFGRVRIGEGLNAILAHFGVDVVDVPTEEASEIGVGDGGGIGSGTLRHGSWKLAASLLAILRG